MGKLKVMTILGTRPEIIRLSEIIKKLDLYFDHVLVHTGQNWDYTLNTVFFEELKIREPDYYLEAADENLGKTMGNIISKSYELIDKLKPDALLILGDTNSSLSAISSKRLKCPIFHMEAGNRCFDENLPEEINRRIVDHIADVNLPYTEHARRYLLSEGIRKEHIYVTGSPMKEVLFVNRENIENSKILQKLKLEPQKYIIISAHREENIDNESNFLNLMNSINSLAEEYRMPIIYSVHPRSQKMIEKRQFKFNQFVQKMKPFGFFDYNKLQENAFLVLSDSGTIPEESSILKFPAISIRTSTERPEAIDKGNIIIAGIKVDEVIQSARLARKMFENNETMMDVPDYSDINVSTKIVKLIQSYTSIINNVIWKKNIN